METTQFDTLISPTNLTVLQPCHFFLFVRKELYLCSVSYKYTTVLMICAGKSKEQIDFAKIGSIYQNLILVSSDESKFAISTQASRFFLLSISRRGRLSADL